MPKPWWSLYMHSPYIERSSKMYFPSHCQQQINSKQIKTYPIRIPIASDHYRLLTLRIGRSPPAYSAGSTVLNPLVRLLSFLLGLLTGLCSSMTSTISSTGLCSSITSTISSSGGGGAGRVVLRTLSTTTLSLLLGLRIGLRWTLATSIVSLRDLLLETE